MPVYNEVDCIVDVVNSWLTTLALLNIKFRIIVLNDGSRDGTKEALEVYKNDYRIEIVNKENSGHGPTILIGYQKAVGKADWTFQCDSDDEMKPDHFPILWEKRHDYDALFGLRTERNQSLARKLISFFSRFIVHVFFGRAVTDVNTPYRMIRSHILKQVIDYIPPNTFAPNVIISGVLSKYRLRVYEHPVPHENRKTGQVSIVKWRLWRAALKSLFQTLSCCSTIRTLNY
jgi:glycosyltransferase involved in cell wall biosynthesis